MPLKTTLDIQIGKNTTKDFTGSQFNLSFVNADTALLMVKYKDLDPTTNEYSAKDFTADGGNPLALRVTVRAERDSTSTLYTFQDVYNNGDFASFEDLTTGQVTYLISFASANITAAFAAAGSNSIPAWLELSYLDGNNVPSTLLQTAITIYNQVDDGAPGTPPPSSPTYLTSAEIADSYFDKDGTMSWGVLSATTGTPPTLTGGEDKYIIPAAGTTGAWVGQEGKIAVDDGSWTYYTPAEGWSATVVDTNKEMQYTSSAWAEIPYLQNTVSEIGEAIADNDHVFGNNTSGIADVKILFSRIWTWVSGKISAISTKATMVNADSFLITDSADSDNPKRTTLTSLKTNTALNEWATPTTNISMATNKITSLGTPTAGTDATNKDYVDGAIQGVKFKDNVDLATTGNITLSGEQTIDGTLTSTSRVAVWQQTDQTQNGIYDTGPGAWSRTDDADTGTEILGATFNCLGGSTYAGWTFRNTNTSAITIGATNITFTNLAQAILHNETMQKQGGTTDEYYHLTNAQHGPLTTLAPSLANLTTQYRGVFVNAAGEVTESSSIITDASGNLINSANTTLTGVVNIGAATSIGQMTVTYDSTLKDGLVIINSAASGRQWRFGDGVGASPGILGFYDATAAATRFVVDASGNFLIGTTSQYASEKLGVNGDLYVNGDSTTIGNTTTNGHNFTAATELTIATGSITATQAVHTIDTEGDAASDDLDTIATGTYTGLLMVRAANAARTVVLKHGTGNLELGGADITLDDDDQYIILYWDTSLSKWLVAGGSGGGTSGHYAGISMEDNATATTITTINVKAQVLQFDTNDPSDGATPDHTNDHITINKTADYLVKCDTSFSGGVSDIYQFDIMKNNGATHLVALERKMGTGGDIGVVACERIVSLSSGDTVELWVTNTSDNDDPTLKHCHLVVSEVGAASGTAGLDINSLTTETTVDRNNDLVAMWDNSASGHRGVLVKDIAPRTGVYRSVYIDAAAMVPRTTNGAEALTKEFATNDIMIDYLAFDSSTEEGVQFKMMLPDEWDRSTIKLKFYWDAAATASGTVVWGVRAGALSNDDPIDAALGTEVTVTDTLLAVGDMHISPATAAVTVGGTPALADMIIFQVVAKTTGTIAVDQFLMGVGIQYKESSTEPVIW